jgi:hypothetical protein
MSWRRKVIGYVIAVAAGVLLLWLMSVSAWVEVIAIALSLLLIMWSLTRW